jgi:uncharacterized protein YcbK (DUF882 family)
MQESQRGGQSGLCKGFTRRDFIRMAPVATVAAAAPGLLFGKTRALHTAEKQLALYNLHTGERLKTVYWAEGRYVPGALDEINWILRDYRRNQVKPIDLRLLDLLYSLDRRLETRRPFHIICGYRSPATNEYLREHSGGVAKHSMHMQAKAVDIRIPGCRLTAVQRAALDMHDGGVGIYPISDFVHVDVGRVRRWRFPATVQQGGRS